jgi:4-hydroxy-tetrahydrodipicolinate synthase
MSTLAGVMGRVSVPLVTPFYAPSEDVNFDALVKLIDFIITSQYADSLILTGTTGEFYTLSDEERVEIWKVAKKTVAGRIPMVAGAGAASTRTTIQLCQEAEKIGFDAIMVIVPYYCRPTQEGIEQHYRSVAAKVSLPILVYNIPLFTGVNMEPETLARLSSLPNIRGIKEEAGIQPTQSTRFAARVPSDFSIYCGDDTMVLQVLPQGGVGVVSGGAQVIGPHMKRMIEAYYQGDNVTASRIYRSLAPFFEELNQNGRINPTPILRAAIEATSGIPIGPPRSPLAPATSSELAHIRPILEQLGAFRTTAV